MTKANPYVYAGDNPVNEVDPSGKESCFSAWKNAFIGVIESDIVAAGALLGITIAQANVASATLADAIGGTGDVAAASAALDGAELAAIGGWIAGLVAAGLVFQTFAQNTDSIVEACS